MVKKLSQNDKTAIAQAIAQGEQQSCAEIICVIMPISDPYIDFILLQGLLLSTLLTGGLWLTHKVTEFPQLMAVQLSVLLLLYFVPPLRRLCWRLVPKRVLQHRSARRAMEEFHAVHRQLPAGMPIVMLFISLGEHYAHILTSHAVFEKIPDTAWDAVIAGFVKTLPRGLTNATIAAIGNIADILAEPFPANGEPHVFSDEVIER